MQPPSLSMQTTIRDEQRDEGSTHLSKRRLVLARVVCGVLAAFGVGLFVISLPGYAVLLQTICVDGACNSGQFSTAALTTLQHLGFSLEQYVAFNVALILIATLISYAVALLLVLRRSDDWMALLVALMLVYFVPGSISNTVVLSQWVDPKLASILTSIPGQSNLLLVALVFYLFPNGRFVPRWTRWVFIVLIGVTLFFLIFPYTSTTWLNVISGVLYVSALISLVIAQIFRYRRVSSPFQRQQTKWVVYSLALTVLLLVGLLLLPQLIIPTLGQAGSLPAAMSNSLGNLLYLPIPLAFGIAILRYRLYDIDILINRTLVYGALTLILTGIYVGLVFGLQALLRGIISQDSSVAVVISTLAIAALFQPLRRRIQRIIDRHFYRSKYDAARAMAAFSATLRHEVDLEQLREQLLEVVQQTMQPTHVSLWLRPPQTDEKQRLNLTGDPPAS
jgi:hypothetical protein